MMKKSSIWLGVALLAGAAMVLMSCAPSSVATSSSSSPAPTSSTPSVSKPASTTSATSAPTYGGYLNTLGMDPMGFDEATAFIPASGPWAQYLMGTNWLKGPAGSNESDYVYGLIGNVNLATGFLAQSWEMPDDSTIIFHIRQGVHYFVNPASQASSLVNGREFTAQDAAFNLNREFFQAKTDSKYSLPAAQKPTSINATDQYTLQVKVNPAYQGTLLLSCGLGSFMYPPEIIQKYGNINDWHNAIGTGPYMLTDYVQGSSMTWVRNPNFWMKDPLHPQNQLPYLDGLKSLIIPDASTQIAAFVTGKIDTMSPVALDDYTNIMKNHPITVSTTRIAPPFVLAGWVNKPDLPFKDIRVRQALNMATDKQDILNSFFGGHGYMLAYPYSNSPSHAAYYTPLDQEPQDVQELFTYNPDKAKQLLAEAGYPNGFTTQILCQSSIYRGISMPDFLSIIKAQWSKVGVDLEINPVDPTVYQSEYRGRAFPQMVFTDGKGYGWPYQFNMFNAQSFDDVAGWDDPTTNDYYNKIQAVLAKNNTAMDQLLKQFGTYILGQAPYVWLPAEDYYTVWQPWLKGYHGEQWLNNSFMRQNTYYVWIDQALKKSLGY